MVNFFHNNYYYLNVIPTERSDEESHIHFDKEISRYNFNKLKSLEMTTH